MLDIVVRNPEAATVAVVAFALWLRFIGGCVEPPRLRIYR